MRYVMGVAGDDRAIMIRLKDAVALAKAQASGAERGGAMLVSLAAPNTLAAKVYSEFAKQLGDQMAQRGVLADVTVESAAPRGSAAAPTDLRAFAIGAGIGAALVGTGWVLTSGIKFFTKRAK